MNVIDDEGRLFGTVNVVDALVVLLVVAVVVAGAALVFGGEAEPDPEVETTYATLDMGVHQPYIVEEISAGDTYSPDESSTMRVTDVHLTPQGGDTRVYLRVALEGQLNDQGSLVYANAPPRLGRTLGLTTDRYEVEGQIRDVGDSDALEREQRGVVLSTQVDAATAQAIAAGDEVRLGGRTVARIENVTAYTTGNPNRRQLFVAATLEAHRQGDGLRFGGQPVRRGQTVGLETEAYSLNGRIEQVGGDLDLGETTSRTVTLRMEEVREDFASTIEAGMAERVGETTVAEITDVVSVEPSLIIVTGSEDASVNVVDHPVNRDVTLRAELQLRDTPGGLSFKGEQIRQGSTVSLDLGTAAIDATVVSIGG
jgi:hypothetical protein